MSGSLAHRACAELAEALGTLEPSLAGRVTVHDQLPTKLSDYPAVVIRPQRLAWKPWQGEPVRDEDGDVVYAAAGRPLYHVATLEGEVQLWAAHKTAAQREELEDALLRAFHATEVPGRLQVMLADIEVAGIATAYSTAITFTFGPSSEWRDELVFSERRWSFLSCDLVVPVLALRTGEYPMTEGRLVFDEDLDADLSSGETPAEKVALIHEPEEYVITESGVSPAE